MISTTEFYTSFTVRLKGVIIMARSRKQKLKWRASREDYDYDEEGNDLREENWERLLKGIPEDQEVLENEPIF